MPRGKKSSGHAGMGGSWNPTGHERYFFGGSEEIDNRHATGYNWRPEDHPPAFKQITPAVTGKNVNDPKPDQRSGNLKFSGGIK